MLLLLQGVLRLRVVWFRNLLLLLLMRMIQLVSVWLVVMMMVIGKFVVIVFRLLKVVQLIEVVVM